MLHNGHFGIMKIKHRARQIIFWPRMDNNIKNIVTNCEVCQQYHKGQQKETYIPHEIHRTSPGLKQAQIYLKFIQKVT